MFYGEILKFSKMKMVCFSFFDIQLKVKLVCFSFFAFRFSLFVFRHSNSGRISHFDIQNPILKFEFGPNIEFWHSKSYPKHMILSIFDIKNLILTFELGPNIEFWHPKSYFDIRIWAKHRFFYIQNLIRTWTEYRIFRFRFSFFVFRHSN